MKQFGWLLIFLLLLSFMLIDKYCHHPIEDALVQLNELQVVVDSLKDIVKQNETDISWEAERILIIESEGYHRGLWSYGFTDLMEEIDNRYLKRKGLLGFYGKTMKGSRE